MAVLLTVFMAWGCGGGDEEAAVDERVYAAVDGSYLTESELRARVPMGLYDSLTPEMRKVIVQEWVQEELLYREALKRGINDEPQIRRLLEKAERDLLKNELIERELAPVSTASDSDLRAYYDSHEDEFRLTDDQYDVRFAQFDNMNDAREFYDQVKRGASFSDLARETSNDVSASEGGALGIVGEETVEPQLWEAIVSTYDKLGAGKISNPFSVIEGFGIVIIDEYYERGTIKPFELVHEQVLDQYLTEQRDVRKQTFIDFLAQEHDVEYYF